MKKNTITILLTILFYQLPVKGQIYYLNVVAGNNQAGYSGDGGLATQFAELFNARGVAVDISGNVYIADTYNNRIRKVDTRDTIRTIAGNGTAGYSGDGGLAISAELNMPQGVAVDDSGNVYIADTYNYCIRKITTNGVITTVAGGGKTYLYPSYPVPATSTNLGAYPYGVAVDNSGNIYIAETEVCLIYKVNTTGLITLVAGNYFQGYSGDGGVATLAALNNPYGIAVDDSGNVYIADTDNNRIRKVDSSGIITTVAGNGTAGYSGDGGLATSAELNYPYGVAVDNLGNIYIGDQSNYCMRKVNTNGIITTIAMQNPYINCVSHNGYIPAISACTLSDIYPYSVAVDNSENVYFAEGELIIELIPTEPTTAVIQSNSLRAVAYPNPTNGNITINSPETAQAIIYNALGETVTTQYMQAGNNSISLDKAASGIYTIILTGGINSYAPVKVVKN